MRIVVGGGVPLFRRGLVQQLAALGVQVEAEATRVGGVCPLLERHRVDAVLLDATGSASLGPPIEDREPGARAPSIGAGRSWPSPASHAVRETAQSAPVLPYRQTVLRIRRLRPAVGLLLLLSPGAAPVRARGLLALPADRFVDGHALVRALVEVATGGPAPDLTPDGSPPRGHGANQGAPGSVPESLTPGEALVLGLLGRGYSNDGIAGTLGLSPKTVECHVSRIFDKLGLPRAASGTNRRVLAAMHWALVGARPDDWPAADQVRAATR